MNESMNFFAQCLAFMDTTACGERFKLKNFKFQNKNQNNPSKNRYHVIFFIKSYHSHERNAIYSCNGIRTNDNQRTIKPKQKPKQFC